MEGLPTGLGAENQEEEEAIDPAPEHAIAPCSVAIAKQLSLGIEKLLIYLRAWRMKGRIGWPLLIQPLTRAQWLQCILAMGLMLDKLVRGLTMS